MTAIKARGEIDFRSDADPDKKIKAGQKWSAGDGVVLRFRNSDLKRVEAELGANWFSKMVDAGTDGIPTVEFLETLVKHGAKKDGEPFVVPEAVLDEIPIIELGLKLLDAACVSMKGMTAKEYFTTLFGALAEQQQKGESPSPASPDGTSSTISENDPSGPASE